jgi:hypothetical protein
MDGCDDKKDIVIPILSAFTDIDSQNGTDQRRNNSTRGTRRDLEKSVESRSLTSSTSTFRSLRYFCFAVIEENTRSTDLNPEFVSPDPLVLIRGCTVVDTTRCGQHYPDRNQWQLPRH